MDEATEKFLKALEEMMDAADDMWEEEKYSNYRQLMKLREERYNPAKAAAKAALVEAIQSIVDQNKCKCSCSAASSIADLPGSYHLQEFN